ncbi:MAG TPA: glycoside hydrolase family 2 TIM barrel-domain containing protein, partial [Acidimicrobiales bacterium]|nr:glycoside hydrolase family 2 TIM barrel-domain containing protein [Acidimicrobiales bacterium]
MERIAFNDGWIVDQKTNRFAERMGIAPEPVAVTLPHDAMIGGKRSPTASPASAYFDGGVWRYRRTFEVSSEDVATCISLEFEGVYRDARVFVNDAFVAHRPYGYSDFLVPIEHVLRFGESNEIRVEARVYEDSRWYPGAGIHRNVWLLRAGQIHLEPRGLQVTTPELDDDIAVVSVASGVSNHSSSDSTAVVAVELLDVDGNVVSRTSAPASTVPGETAVIRHRLVVARPRRWGPDDPYLYSCRVTLEDENEVLDVEVTTFGIRALSLDPVRGLRINGEPILLRGACVHHDNGPLGACTIDRAEERRVEILKAAGFNAIRSAHNPLSRAMLHACDQLGVLVLDEAFDMWAEPKSEYDYALRFPDWWEADIEAMVRKDLNHPSVIMYSIGNEVPEAGRPYGARLGRALAEKVRSLDGTRFVTEAISGLLIGGPELIGELRKSIDEGMARQAAETGDEAGVNTAMTNLADWMSNLMTSPVVDALSAETLSYLDVAGYNYMESRFEIDGELHPNRTIVATETHPAAIDTGWAGVVDNPHVIGDFVWTGWDYLGEAGIGRTNYITPGQPGDHSAFQGAFPWLTAWCGDIDITGHRRPQSYFREIIFGLRTDPYIAVGRPQHHGQAFSTTPWSWSDVISSWSWEGHEGGPVSVEVYADADEVELLVNGKSVGTQPAGKAGRYRAVFETAYEPGRIEAVARRAGTECGRTELQSASGPAQLEAVVDRAEITAGSHDLAYVALTLVDSDGQPFGTGAIPVEVAVDGPGVLQALGSA